ncbi:hypothetical protein SRABI70_03342 [Pseudomonas sp. Bi70]|uniref:hypothetical protein n=1 Tax=unclassified Pseudomonas TaxID=196821 RepID=UPI0017871479|nr:MULTISPECIES: hypothetical protein [unclassified Pseudomonas]MBD9656267.1 hypothetical protein [Pseudomonas sp. PDM12]CAH0265907.1 hypothetical protein SRABI70_03342 [Pseudomonas sp. Bi70]
MQPDNPYKASLVELIDDLPVRQLPGWSVRQLQVLGWLALMSGLGSALMLGVVFVSSWLGQAELEQVERYTRWLGLLLMLLGNYLLLRLKSFIEQRFVAQGLSWPVWIIVVLALIIGLMDFMVGDQVFKAPSVLTIAYLGLMVPMGLCITWFAVRLLKVRRAYASLRIMAWLSIASGLMFASVLLLPLALLPALAVCVAQGLVFLRGASELREQQAAA